MGERGSFDGEARTELVVLALQEAFENLETIKRSLGVLSRTPAEQTALTKAHRAAHTLHGTGNAVGPPFTGTAVLMKPVEDLLGALCRSDGHADGAVRSLLADCMSVLDQMLGSIREGGQSMLPHQDLLERLASSLKEGGRGVDGPGH